MVLSPTIYGDFQDQPRFERKRKKKQCKERAVKKISKSVMLQKLERSCVPSPQHYPENTRCFQ